MSLDKNPDHWVHLNFHGLGKPTREISIREENYWVDQGLFATVLDHVQGRNEINITIDDANETDYTIALPLLRERKLQASFFVVASRIDQRGFLSREQLRMLSSEGMTIGSHGMWHSRWKGMSQAQLLEELVTARDIIQQIVNTPVTTAACPFGSYDRSALKMLREEGYQRVYTSDGGLAVSGSWLQPRNTIGCGHQLDYITNLINTPPQPLKRCWRDSKMLIKSWL